jgi:LmbE family N-acetylglucosaminyl deacetylase
MDRRRSQVATIVSFHAHPDDEALLTGGTLAKAAAEGHRVVVVMATRGEQGNVPEGGLQSGEDLSARRTGEAREAAALLGVHRLEFLGYLDSGRMGAPQNHAAGSFSQADVEEAAGKLTEILRDEAADVLTIYDDHGTYGHPDHIQIHRVGVRAGDAAGTRRVYEATANRDEIQRQIARARSLGVEIPGSAGEVELQHFGTSEANITTVVDVSGFLRQKRNAMAAHASQMPESSFFLMIPPELFAEAFGTEWFIRRGVDPQVTERDLLEGLESI